MVARKNIRLHTNPNSIRDTRTCFFIHISSIILTYIFGTPLYSLSFYTLSQNSIIRFSKSINTIRNNLSQFFHTDSSQLLLYILCISTGAICSIFHSSGIFSFVSVLLYIPFDQKPRHFSRFLKYFIWSYLAC